MKSLHYIFCSYQPYTWRKNYHYQCAQWHITATDTKDHCCHVCTSVHCCFKDITAKCLLQIQIRNEMWRVWITKWKRKLGHKRMKIIFLSSFKQHSVQKKVIVITSLSAFCPKVPAQCTGTRASETTTQHFEKSFFWKMNTHYKLLTDSPCPRRAVDHYII